ncbi:MAG: PucC family protein [Burkholderiales bacterium]|jgi:BCD family chlorophyll transporter-like MFS transporter|nr:PucC family protein [Betaproteobacteria bacterium]
MNRVSRKIIETWANLGPRYLPFADVATAEVPLSRLLRLSLFQVSVGMALVLLVGTINRVMIVELGVSASLVAIMISLPVIVAPFRALIGHSSDTHRSALGWKRVPFIWRGTMIQFGGLAIMPFALLALSGGGNAQEWPAWVGQAGAGLAFFLVGAGLHMIQTAGLALATDLVSEESQPNVVGLMYVMLLFGTLVSALVFGWALADFSPLRLVQVIQAAAVVTMVLNIIALWKQEPRNRKSAMLTEMQPSFRQAWNNFTEHGRALRRLTAIGLGTMAFSMQDILLEPYGGQILNMSVSATTRLTAALALGGLIGFGYASRVLSQGADPFRIASYGAGFGVPAFIAVIFSASFSSPLLFAFGAFLIGLGGGLFSHGTLTATMNHAPSDQRGLALGAWGAVQATAAGVAVSLGGVLRDVVSGITVVRGDSVVQVSPESGYVFVYILEIILMLAALSVMAPLIKPAEHSSLH